MPNRYVVLLISKYPGNGLDKGIYWYITAITHI